MRNSQRRLLVLVVSLPIVLGLGALAYMLGMQALEGESRTYLQSLEWAAETLTTTGYGADTAWQHPLMVAFVIGWQFVGLFLVFLVFPVYLIPFLEERFEKRLQTHIKPTSGHVVIYRYGAAVESLLEETLRFGLETVVIESDETVARRLTDQGLTVLYGSLQDDVLDRAHVASARTLIANSSDDDNAAAIVSARQSGCSGEILALVEDPLHRQPILLAGATKTFTPHHALGAALASQASGQLGQAFSATRHLGRGLSIREVRIDSDSPLAGRTLADAGIGRESGVTVLGQWVGGTLQTDPMADTPIVAGGILVVAGSTQAAQEFAESCAPSGALPSGPILVAGYGEVGAKVAELLRAVGEPVTVLDRSEVSADAVGDALDSEFLTRVGIADARSVVLALDSDPATLFASVIIRDLAPHLPIIARVNHSENVERIHAAGADFALSISRIAGQMLARELLGEEAIALEGQLKVMKTTLPSLAGLRSNEIDIRERTGCSVVAVERGADLIVDLGAEFQFEADDTIFVAGSDDASQAFFDLYGRSA